MHRWPSLQGGVVRAQTLILWFFNCFILICLFFFSYICFEWRLFFFASRPLIMTIDWCVNVCSLGETRGLVGGHKRRVNNGKLLGAKARATAVLATWDAFEIFLSASYLDESITYKWAIFKLKCKFISHYRTHQDYEACSHNSIWFHEFTSCVMSIKASEFVMLIGLSGVQFNL